MIQDESIDRRQKQMIERR